jgi:hypothetical protein
MNKIYTVPITIALAVGLLAGCSSTVTPKHANTTASTSIASAPATPPPNISTETGVANPTTFPPAKPKYTVAQQNAIEAAKAYLDMAGFSRAGLIKQLSSQYGEGYKKADAVFAVNHIKVDWNKEAVESAKSYLAMTSFSRAGLIQQLTSDYGEGFTLAQATYAANHVGL